MGMCKTHLRRRKNRLVVIGDSDLIIKGLRRHIKNSHPTLATIFSCIRELEKIFERVNYYHILRMQNSSTNSLAKATKNLEQSILKVNDEIKYELLP
jgi:hypothetical protein